MAAQRTPLPGFGGPAVGFDTPFEMLEACHERVQRTLALLERLQDYLHTNACDDSARQAARDVLRYFDVAAPLHHEDEEQHVFPPVLAHGIPAAAQAVRRLQADHEAMHSHWQAARVRLLALAQGEVMAFTAEDETLFERFVAVYQGHIRTEEDLVYPAAQALLGSSALAAMGEDMRRRRGVV